MTQPHRRWNPLRKEWILVSPHRTKRPWQGSVEKTPANSRPAHDPKCYLCPGNERAGGFLNPDYPDTFAFDNDFPAVLSPELSKEEGAIEYSESLNGIVRSAPQNGRCRVICFSPRHDLTLPEMEISAIRRVVDLWQNEYTALGNEPYINHVMTFENKGAIMGCSNPHPHGQIWATETVPDLPNRALQAQTEYADAHGSLLLADYLKWELERNERIVERNASWVSLVPYWATWPFETMILPCRSGIACVEDLTDTEKNDWAEILKKHLVRYDNLFETSFPYSMGIYQRPTDGDAWKSHQMHQVFFPPLLRSATIKKFMVGFELCAEPQRDITPEQAAERLRACNTVHYKETLA
jgi:UDPglucose--hexose-1-phosphate uridylyltransferase